MFEGDGQSAQKSVVFPVLLRRDVIIHVIVQRPGAGGCLQFFLILSRDNDTGGDHEHAL